MSAAEPTPTTDSAVPGTEPLDPISEAHLQLALHGLQGRINAYYNDRNRDPYHVGGAQLDTTQTVWTAERIIYQHIADAILKQATYQAHPGLGNYVIRYYQLDQILTDLAAEDMATIAAETPTAKTVAWIHKQIRQVFTDIFNTAETAIDAVTPLDISLILRYLDEAYWHAPLG